MQTTFQIFEDILKLLVDKDAKHTTVYLTRNEYAEVGIGLNAATKPRTLKECEPGGEFEGCLDTEWVDEEDHTKAVVTNSFWTLQWYPHSPVGSYRIDGFCLDKLMVCGVVETMLKQIPTGPRGYWETLTGELLSLPNDHHHGSFGITWNEHKSYYQDPVSAIEEMRTRRRVTFDESETTQMIRDNSIWVLRVEYYGTFASSTLEGAVKLFRDFQYRIHTGEAEDA